MYKALIKPLFFLLSPEKAHYLAMDLLSLACKIPGGKWLMSTLFRYNRPTLEKEVFGIKFPNPVGLAAGFDKDARWIDSLDALGFGFIEIGTLTPKAQDGNPKPRLFRLPEDESLINRMGFNNQGVDAAVARLRQRKSRVIVGGNIGKNKVTPNEKAVDDYVLNFLKLFDVVDYFVVNVSSPNTPNLRALQEKEPLKELLSSLQTVNLSKPAPKPILLKIAPDLTNSQLDDVVEIVTETGIAGIIATNTTISRDGLVTDRQKVEQIGAGGLSGKILKSRSTEVIRYLHEKTGGSIPIIGVGGISTAADAKEKLDAGASLVQVYSGFIYEGPAIVKNILKQL
ncbi:quinone-dependent dihydroorotate dehydrogenase [Imperialibacter roseus]|uniref:Dihydroorotate dehydrogenase (quinone) n=1 Tax=Imperialibacter roseus TaxID=1324217 RepID=A0ABZ0IVH3_9BACT|nr:quinone-dependent dihydroorotate dehydrogenase [Imperialibacter roseus]WOK08144.1 quinone-dependent dihydroorotate dehydrogenase [Imperialibacter roseus]